MPPPSFVQTLLRTVPTVAPVSHRALISVTGVHAPEFLNGILASSVPAKGPFFSTFLHAQGRVLYDVFVYTHTAENGQRAFVIEHDARPSEAQPLSTLLKRYVLRSKVKIRDVSADYGVWAAWGKEPEPDRAWKWASSGAVEPAWEREPWPWGVEDWTLRDRRAVGMGRRMLVRAGDRPAEASTHDVAPTDAYTLHRVLHGVPEGIDDIPPMQAFPMDSNLDVMGGLDFRKGCYVGQELTVRTYHTGVVRKRILPIAIHRPDGTLASTATFTAGLDIRASVVRSPDDPRPVPRPRGTGKLLTSIQGVGLALLRLEHIEGARVGDLKLQFEAADNDIWGITHWWPDWFPQAPVGGL